MKRSYRSSHRYSSLHATTQKKGGDTKELTMSMIKGGDTKGDLTMSMIKLQ
jgi:hypothetical protein